MASQQLDMFNQPLLPSHMTKVPATPVGRALPDGTEPLENANEELTHSIILQKQKAMIDRN